MTDLYFLTAAMSRINFYTYSRTCNTNRNKHNKANVEIETQPVTAETNISNCLKSFKYLHTF